MKYSKVTTSLCKAQRNIHSFSLVYLWTSA